MGSISIIIVIKLYYSYLLHELKVNKIMFVFVKGLIIYIYVYIYIHIYIKFQELTSFLKII